MLRTAESNIKGWIQNPFYRVREAKGKKSDKVKG